MSGYIYILSNPIFSESLIKIGKSDHHPRYRKRELDSATAIPMPFVLQYAALVVDHHTEEKRVHRLFANRRINARREFFEVSIDEAIVAIQGTCEILSQEIIYRTPQQIESEKSRQLQMDRDQRAQIALDVRNATIVDDWLRTHNKIIMEWRDKALAQRSASIYGRWLFISFLTFGFMMIAFTEPKSRFAAGFVVFACCLALVIRDKFNAWQDIKQANPLKVREQYEHDNGSTAQLWMPFKCPRCDQKIRLPVGKRLKVCCPKCRFAWIRRT